MKLILMNYVWLDPFGQRYVGSRKGAAIGDATLMKLIGFSRCYFGSSRRGEELWPIEASRRDGETSRRGEETSFSGEVVWPVGLHIEVKCCDLEEQVYLPVRRY